MWESKLDVLIDLRILDWYDNRAELGYDFIVDDDYIDFFNDCIDKYSLNINKINKLEEIYEIEIKDDIDVVRFYMLEDKLERILIEE